MKRLIALIAAAGALALAACDDPQRNDDQPDVTPPPADQTIAPTAEDSAAPVAATAAPPHVDSSTLPSEKRTSEESVKPDSDTLFY